MYTVKELKKIHYELWNSIAKCIDKECSVIDIESFKAEYLNNRDIDLVSDCAICEYNVSYNDANCNNCPSLLKTSESRLCLSGVYHAALKTKCWLTQYDLSILIRDSWK